MKQNKRKVHNVVDWVLILLTVFYLSFGYAGVNIEVQLIALWHEIIKGFDPFDFMDNSLSPSDFAKFYINRKDGTGIFEQ